MRRFFSKLKDAFARFFRWTDAHPITQCGLVALFLALLIEVFNRRSLIHAFGFVFSHFIFFLFTFLIIFTTLCIANFFAKRYFFLATISILWFILGLVNFIIRLMRVTPFEANDFLVIGTGFSIIFVYLNIFEIIGILLALLAVPVGLFFLYRHTKKQPIQWKKALIAFGSSVAASALITTSLVVAQFAPKRFNNLVEAYEEYGFLYCFASSIFDKGIDEPDVYSQESIDAILEGIAEEKVPDSEDLPNILFVQLESFYDVNHLKNMTFSENPVPYFTYLREHYTSGWLTVPTIGAGTANTEFEVLTGLSVNDFGTGEYPYKTILKEATCESLAFALKDLGYYATAMHNNTGAFYDRNIVFANLGFDLFDSLEYMNDYNVNSLGWAEDICMIPSIIEIIQSTEARNFMEIITVQAHGRYPTADPETEPAIRVEGAEDLTNEMEYFVSQIKATDDFMKELLTQLEALPEKTIVVFYGDHLPGMDITEEELSEGNLQQTEYILWSNYPLEKKDRDVTSYQLGSYVLQQAGIQHGIIHRFHQASFSQEPSEELDSALEALSYDILYGKQYLYHGNNPHMTAELKMGWHTVVLESYTVEDKYVVLHGKNFTKDSRVYVNNHRRKTTFVSDTELRIKYSPDEGDEIYVAQVSYEWLVLSQTDSLFVD